MDEGLVHTHAVSVKDTVAQPAAGAACMPKPIVIWIRKYKDMFDGCLDRKDWTKSNEVRRVESGVLHDATLVGGGWGRQQTCGCRHAEPDCGSCNGHGYFIWWIEEEDGEYIDDTRHIRYYREHATKGDN
jgi:hypothetical protein